MATNNSKLNVLISPSIGNDEQAGLKALYLPKPSNGQKALVYYKSANKQLLQTSKVDLTMKQSWLIGNNMYKDGSFYIMSEIDETFILLCILESTSLPSKYVEYSSLHLEAKFRDQEISEDVKYFLQLESVLNGSIPRICDTEDVGTDLFVRLNESKVGDWLVKKVECILGGYKDINCLAKSTRSKECLMMDDHRLINGLRTCEAIALLSHYLTPKWQEFLFDQFKTKEMRAEVKKIVENSLGSHPGGQLDFARQTKIPKPSSPHTNKSKPNTNTTKGGVSVIQMLFNPRNKKS